MALRTYTTNHQVFIMNKFMNARVSELIDVDSLLPKFETLKACWKEKDVRINKLLRSVMMRRGHLLKSYRNVMRRSLAIVLRALNV